MPDLPLSNLGNGIYVFDDTSVDYGSLLINSMMMSSMVPSPPGGGGGGGGTNSPPSLPPTVPIPGVPLLKMETLDEGVKLVSFNTKTNFLYRVEATENLSNPIWTTIHEFVATETNSDFIAEGGDMQFYRVVQDDGIIQFPDWFDSVWQYLRFDVYTTVTNGNYTMELYADGDFAFSSANAIPSDGHFFVHDSGYNPADWPNTGYYGVAEWELRVSVTPATPPGVAAAPTTFKNVKKAGRQRNPRSTYFGAVTQQIGIFSPFPQDEVDDFLLLYAGATYQPSELINLNGQFWEPEPDRSAIPPNCNIWGTNEWAKLRGLITGTSSQYIDYLHYLGHGNASQIGGGTNAGGGKITMAQLQNSELKTNAMTYVALDACRAANGTAFLKAWTGYGATMSYADFARKGLNPALGCSWTKIKGVEWVNQGLLVHNHFYFWGDWYVDLTRRNQSGLMYRRYKDAYAFAKDPMGQGISNIQTNPEASGFKMVGCDECRFDERPGMQ